MNKIQNSIISAFVATLVLLFFVSCSSDAPKQANHDLSISEIGVPEIPTVTTLSLSASQKESLKQANDFSFNLLSAMAENYDKCFDNKDGNFAVSPLSTNIALGMASNFMDGTMKSSTLATLGYSRQEDLNETSRQIIAFLNNSENTSMELYLANSLWWWTHYEQYLNKEIVARISNFYYAQSFGVDFFKDSTYDLMNEWVAEYTGNKIVKMFGEKQRTIETIIQVCINALYAKGEWLVPFPAEDTRKATFFGEDGENLTVDMMHNLYCGDYTRCDNFEVFTIPFKGTTTMTVILPSEGMSATELSKGFSKELWNDAVVAMTPASLMIDLPKFTIETSADMNKAMEAMGIDFEKKSRNLLYNISDNSLGLDIIQKTFLSINEEGAEVAVATACIAAEGIPDTQLPVVSISVDRPFLYFITERTTGSVLLAGRVCRPNGRANL